jgi:hypothetical protein
MCETEFCWDAKPSCTANDLYQQMPGCDILFLHLQQFWAQSLWTSPSEASYSILFLGCTRRPIHHQPQLYYPNITFFQESYQKLSANLIFVLVFQKQNIGPIKHLMRCYNESQALNHVSLRILSSFTILTIICSGRPISRGSIPARDRDLSLFLSVQTDSRAKTFSYPVGSRVSSSGIKQP